MTTEAQQHSQKIKAEADKLVAETNISKLLEQFGTVDLGGSYAYDLMVDRDLDFGVAIKAMTPEKVHVPAEFEKQ